MKKVLKNQQGLLQHASRYDRGAVPKFCSGIFELHRERIHILSLGGCRSRRDMVALPLVQIRRKYTKPRPLTYPKHPCSIGEHLRKRRMELGLFQRDLADILGVSEDCVTYWETNKSEPQINYFPKIHRFLGYSPLKFDESKFVGRLKAFRWKKGLSHESLGKLLAVNGSTVCSWENGKSLPRKHNQEQLEVLFKKNV